MSTAPGGLETADDGPCFVRGNAPSFLATSREWPTDGLAIRFERLLAEAVVKHQVQLAYAATQHSLPGPDVDAKHALRSYNVLPRR